MPIATAATYGGTSFQIIDKKNNIVKVLDQDYHYTMRTGWQGNFIQLGSKIDIYNTKTMITGNNILLSILISMNLIKLQDCDCEMWFKRLASSSEGIGTFAEKLPEVSWTNTGTIVQDSVGPYGDIFMSIIINDNDSIVCSKIVKGDSTLLPKIEKFLSKQTVASSEISGRKVYSIFAIRLQFVEPSKDKSRRRKNRL